MCQWFLCFRYLFSRAIPFAALVVVASSVALLIIIVSVMEGFRAEHQDRIRGTGADIRVTSKQYINLRDSAEALAAIEAVPGVVGAAPYVDTMVLYESGPSFLRQSTLETRFLRGLEVDRDLRPGGNDEVQLPGGFVEYIEAADMVGLGFRRVPEDPRELFSEEWREKGLWESSGFSRPPGALPPAIVVGKEHLRADRLVPGATVSLTAYSPTTQQPISGEFMVSGYFKTGIYDLDSRGILMSLDDLDQFLDLKAEDGRRLRSGIRVTADPSLRDESSLKILRAEIEQRLDQADIFFVRVETWREERATLLQALKVEKGLTSFILGLTVLFGGFMIFIILTVQVVEKTKDIGVLQSMGLTPWSTAGVFFRMGVTLCVVGTIIGAIYGTGFAYFVNDIQRLVKLLTGWEAFPLSVFYMDEIPVRFLLVDLSLIVIPTVVASMVASLLPAYRAARKRPADALRYE